VEALKNPLGRREFGAPGKKGGSLFNRYTNPGAVRTRSIHRKIR